MISVDFIIAETVSPFLRSSFSTDSLVIMAVISAGDSIVILTLAITAPTSTFFILPSKTFLALIFIISPQFLCYELLYTLSFKKLSYALNGFSYNFIQISVKKQ